MTDPSAKKRKRPYEAGSKPKKKVALDATPSTATVSSVYRAETSPPVIATTPGLKLPGEALFCLYTPNDDRIAKAKRSNRAADTELLLHSNSHHSLDFTAREERARGSKPVLSHYIAVFDPQTGGLQVIEARKMVVRGTVRSKQAPAEAMDKAGTYQTVMDRRAALGQTFGTKKARKAIEDSVLNAISTQKKAGNQSPSRIDDGTRAMLGTVGEVTSTMASRKELQAVVDAAKPVPVANAEAEDIEDVYDPNVIIGSDVLRTVPIREWQEKARAGESIQVLSRFVAARVAALAASDESTTQLRVLRYMYFVLIFYLSTKPGKQRGTRQLPRREELKEKLQPAPEAVIENIRRAFSDGGTMRKFHIDLLMTHLCAFACIVDNYEVDTQNLKDDLRLDQKTINQYFHEIGGRVRPVSNKELGRIAHVARLALPLNFPRQRHVNPKRR